jgi:hypothetical protein
VQVLIKAPHPSALVNHNEQIAGRQSQLGNFGWPLANVLRCQAEQMAVASQLSDALTIGETELVLTARGRTTLR